MSFATYAPRRAFSWATFSRPASRATAAHPPANCLAGFQLRKTRVFAKPWRLPALAIKAFAKAKRFANSRRAIRSPRFFISAQIARPLSPRRPQRGTWGNGRAALAGTVFFGGGGGGKKPVPASLNPHPAIWFSISSSKCEHLFAFFSLSRFARALLQYVFDLFFAKRLTAPEGSVKMAILG